MGNPFSPCHRPAGRTAETPAGTQRGSAGQNAAGRRLPGRGRRAWRPRLLQAALLLAAWVVPVGLATAAEVHVAPHGSDTHAGTAAQPFASLERARAAIRQARQRNPQQAMTIWLHGGHYPRQRSLELTTEDSGTSSAPLVIAAWQGQRPVLSGMAPLPKAAFAPVTDAEVLRRIIDPTVRPRLLQADLRAAGITDFGRLGRRGFRIPGHHAAPAPVHLHHGGERQPLARWPNPDEGFPALLSRFQQARLGAVARSRIIDPGPVLDDGSAFWERGGTIGVAFDRLAHWARAEDVWLDGVFGASWEWSYNRVAALDPAQRRITLATGEVNGIRADWSGDFFFAENLLEEIDRPGEWFIDRQRGLLYLLPPASWNEADHRTELSSLAPPMIRLRNASHVVLRGLILEGGRNVALAVEGGQGVRLERSEVRNFSLGGVRMAGLRHGVSGSRLRDIGGAAISLTCGDTETLARGDCFAEDNHIHDWGWYQKVYAGAVTAFGVGQRILHNHIHNGPHGAVFIFGNDHLLEGNRFHHVVETFIDMGAVYANTGARPLQRGHVVRRNHFHDIGQVFTGQAAVYLDNMSRGWVVEENLFERIGGGRAAPVPGSHAVKLNSASHILVRHNLFLDSVLPISLGSHAARVFLPRFRPIWEQEVPPDRLAQLPHLQRYPELARFWSEDHRQPAEVRFERNAIWNHQVPLRATEGARADQRVIEATLDQIGTMRRSGNWIAEAPSAARPTEAQLRRHIPDFPAFDRSQFGPRSR